MPTGSMDLFDAIYTTRATRKLRHDLPVPDEDVYKILDAGIQAANGGNRQVWKFIVVRDPRIKRQLGDLYRELVNWVTSSNPNRKLDSGELYLGEHMAESPVIIVVCGISSGNEPPDEATAVGATMPAIENMLLAARALGYGGNISAVVRRRQDDLRRILGLGPNAYAATLLPIGVPQGSHGLKSRLPVEEVTYDDTWGNPTRLKRPASVWKPKLELLSEGDRKKGRG
ncbi:MAG: hypothetical protein FJ318_01135 [SAR202 cluster bacterium]|nr:hypothetical protein [SAR202 cluster bacterium]